MTAGEGLSRPDTWQAGDRVTLTYTFTRDENGRCPGNNGTEYLSDHSIETNIEGGELTVSHLSPRTDADACVNYRAPQDCVKLLLNTDDWCGICRSREKTTGPPPAESVEAARPSREQRDQRTHDQQSKDGQAPLPIRQITHGAGKDQEDCYPAHDPHRPTHPLAHNGTLLDTQSICTREAASRRPEPAPVTDREPCTDEMWSLDYWTDGQVDPYWMRCDKTGPHEEHDNSDTGAHWGRHEHARSGQPAHHAADEQRRGEEPGPARERPPEHGAAA